MASSTASLVTALKTTRSTGTPAKAFLRSSTCSTCQEIASPSRSGSVARISFLAPFTALAISSSRLAALGSTSQCISKSLSGRTEPFFDGRSRTWPYEASTRYPGPRYLLTVFALAGDSTITMFIETFLAAQLRRAEGRRIRRDPGYWPENGDLQRACQIYPKPIYNLNLYRLTTATLRYSRNGCFFATRRSLSRCCGAGGFNVNRHKNKVVGHGGNRHFGPAEFVDERPKGRGPYVLAADQPEPRKTLTAAEPRGMVCRR